MILSHKVLDKNKDNDKLIIYKSCLNYVPADAVIRKRLVLFIFNGFKGYLDGKLNHKWD